MQYSILGKSDLQISRIGFGAMSLSLGQEANSRLIQEAVGAGINFFDTADLYDKGLNEEIIGKALSSYRKKVIIATKVGNQWRADGSGWDWNPGKDYILASIEKSLRRLNTDYIDLYQLHGGTLDDPIDEIIGTFESLKEQGKIRQYGISSIRPSVIREYVKRSSIVSVMSQYSLLDRRPEETVFKLLEENNIGVLVRGAVAQGLLIDKPAKEYVGHSVEEVKSAASAMKNISSNRTAAQSAIQFVLRHPAVTSAVVGMRTPEQFREIVGTIEAEQMSDVEYETLRNAIPANIYELHR
jgi:aryl-alcohol dehydrogenase-like predicted oxidoreductase